jgi:bacillopeptidase F
MWARQAMMFLLLVAAAVFIVLRWGLPLLVKLAVFLGDIKAGTEKVEQADTIAPIAPQLLSLPVATFSAQIKVAGFAETGSKVTVYVNSQARGEVVTDSNGGFEVDKVGLAAGKNGVWAVAVDQAGNKSQDAAVVYVDMDDIKPELTLESPTDQTTTAASNIEIKGKVSEPEAEVTVNGRFVPVSAGGSFAVKISLNPGENKLNIKARDRAGNEAMRELTVKREE